LTLEGLPDRSFQTAFLDDESDDRSRQNNIHSRKSATRRACGMFAAGGSPSCYCVQSQAAVGLFRLFLETIKGNDI
jgi:hypothetical protein